MNGREACCENQESERVSFGAFMGRLGENWRDSQLFLFLAFGLRKVFCLKLKNGIQGFPFMWTSATLHIAIRSFGLLLLFF